MYNGEEVYKFLGFGGGGLADHGVAIALLLALFQRFGVLYCFVAVDTDFGIDPKRRCPSVRLMLPSSSASPSVSPLYRLIPRNYLTRSHGIFLLRDLCRSDIIQFIRSKRRLNTTSRRKGLFGWTKDRDGSTVNRSGGNGRNHRCARKSNTSSQS